MSKQKRLKPKHKREKASWHRRNEARSVLQKQYAARLAKEQAEREAADALLGAAVAETL